MSVLVKIKTESHVHELCVNEDTTVGELVTSICRKEKCLEEQVALAYKGFPLARDQTMTGLGAAPVLDMLIIPDMKTITSLKFEPTDEDSELIIRFPIGTWLETKIKGSILVEADDALVNQWCLGKVVEHTETGYILEIFENYKYLMPPKIEATFDEVRVGRKESIDFARAKSDEDSKNDENSESKIPEEKRSEAAVRSSRKPKPPGLAHRATKSALFKKGRRKPGLTTPTVKKRKSWSAGQRRRSKQNLLETTEENREAYRSKVKEFTEKYPTMDPSDVKLYVRVFRSELDKRRRGVITKTVLKRWIKANKIDLEESTVDELLAALDLKDAKVSLDNFISIMCSSSRAKPKNDDARDLFNKFDLDGDNVISKSELKTGMKNIFGEDMSEDKLTQMIKAADSTGCGAICFEDFSKMMKRWTSRSKEEFIDVAGQKSGEDFKYDVNSESKISVETQSEDALRSSRKPKPTGKVHRATKSALIKKGRRKAGLTKPSAEKRKSWSAGQRKTSKQNLREISEDQREDYSSKVKEYTAKYPSMDPSDVKMYVRVFRSELDKRRKGVITKNAFKRWIKANQIDLDESTIDELLGSLDLKDAKLSMDNFINIMCSSSKAKPKTDETRELFNKFDLDGDAVISLSELKTGMKNIFGQEMSEDKLTQMIKEADSTGLGAINFEDFSKMMKR